MAAVPASATVSRAPATRSPAPPPHLWRQPSIQFGARKPQMGGRRIAAEPRTSFRLRLHRPSSADFFDSPFLREVVPGRLVSGRGAVTCQSISLGMTNDEFLYR